MLNVDTHIVVKFFEGSLRADELSLMEANPVGISAIVIWEMAKLKQLGRIPRGPEDPEVDAFLRKLRVWPVDAEIAIMSTKLDISSDPADEIIAATSIVHQVPLLTRDAKLRSSKLVPLALS